MSERLTVQITGTNGVSQVFRQVTSDAQRMGTTVEQSASRASRSFEGLSKAGAAIGATLGTVAGVLADASRASENSAQVQRQLQQAIENTGAAFDDYAPRIDAAGKRAVQLGIDDETAAQAIQRLTEITGNAGTALDLLGLAEDVAAARGMDLTSAATLVGRVHEGNVGILQRYGIAVEQGSSATAALAQLQAQVAGQAEAHATSLDIWRAKLDNVYEAAGATLGSLAPYLTMLPGLSTAFSGVATAVGAVAPKLATLAVGMGPLGLVAAAGAAVVGIGALVDLLTTDYAEAVKAADTATSNLATTIAHMGAAGDPFTLTANTWTLALTQTGDQVETLVGQLAELKRQRDEIEASATGKTKDEIAESVTPQLKALDAQIAKIEALVKALGGAKGATESYTDANDALNAIIQDTGPGMADVRKRAAELFDQFGRGEIGIVGLWSGLIQLAGAIGDYDRQAIQASEAATRLGRTTRQATVDLRLFHAPIVDIGDGAKHATASFHGLEDELRAQGATAQKTLSVYHDLAGYLDQFAKNKPITFGMTAPDLAGLLPDLDTSQLESELLGVGDAFWGIRDGALSASDALATFKGVQDGLIASEEKWSQQRSEYSTQLRLLEDTYDIIQEKQKNGIALTQEELDFLDRYPEAYARLNGGVEDATQEQGKLALQYAENMLIGDKLNEMLKRQKGITTDNVGAFRDLLGALEGLPADTKVQVEQIGAEASQQAVARLGVMLGDLDGNSASVSVTANTRPFWDVMIGMLGQTIGSAYVNVYANRIGFGPTEGYLGGVMGYARGGAVLARLGEAGGEALRFPAGGYGFAPVDGIYAVPRGTYVHTADTPKSRAMAQRRETGGGITITGPVYIYPATGDVQAEFEAAMLGQWRAR